MIAIRNIEHLHWRNRFADYPVSVVSMDADELANWRFDSLSAAVRSAVVNRFPLLESELPCASAFEFLAALCLSMQHEKCSVPLQLGTDGAHFWFAAPDPFYASNVAVHSLRFLGRLLRNSEIAAALEELEDNTESTALDQTVRGIVKIAEKRGIPWFRMAGSMRDVQLGQGHQQQRMRESIPGNESLLSVSYSRDKVMTCQLLAAVGLPVGHYAQARTPAQAVAAAQKMGFPVVLKPTHGGKGRDVFVGLATPAIVQDIATQLFTRWPQIIVQSFLPGDDHRLLVVGGRLVGAIQRIAAAVTGDGKHTVQELIDIENLDPRRGKKFYKAMSYIVIDDEVQRILADQGLTLSSVAVKGTKVQLRLTANISTGGTSVDVTDIIHPDNVLAAERAASAIGLKVCGVDLLTPDISRSWREVGGGICELNASPGLRPHLTANSLGDIENLILNEVIAPGSDGRIPTALITGSKDRTAVARMLTHILQTAGHVTGSVMPDGTSINGTIIGEKPVTGIVGAEMLLRDATVTAAVMVAGRDDLEKSGLCLDKCDVAALLALEDAGMPERRIMETARHRAIFNADDHHCLEMSKHFPTPSVILFTGEASSAIGATHVAAGGTVVQKSKKTIIIQAGKAKVAILDWAQDDNWALATVALAFALGIPVAVMAAGLSTYR